MTNLTLAENSKEVQVYNAILNHDVAKFREALSEGFDPEHIFTFDAQAVDEFNLLAHAVSSEFREGIDILLRETNIHIWKGFRAACRIKNDEVIRLFLQIASERRRCWSEYLVILLNHDIVNLALEFVQMNGFNVDDQTLYLPEGLESPLHISARFQEPQLLECLIERGAKLDILDRNGLTALHLTCTKGSYHCCRCLLRHGAIPNLDNTTSVYVTGRQRSPLYILAHTLFPAKKEVEEVVKLLLSAGLDMNKERWILNGHGRHNITGDTLCLLTSLCRVPSALETICVRAIRQHLVKLTTGRSILSRVQELPVPLLLKAQMLVSDSDPSFSSTTS